MKEGLMRAITILGLATMVALGGCQTMRSARDRLVRAPKVCQDVTVPIYFEPNVAQVSPDGRRVIAAAAAQARGCRVEAVRVMGLADAAGDPAANLELSKRRAASVADAIARARLPTAEFDVAAAGQAGAVTKDGELQPVRRRADVTLKLKAQK
jgi:outer membrane protein OmpA-like peptidoglycan-associated protein